MSDTYYATVAAVFSTLIVAAVLTFGQLMRGSTDVYGRLLGLPSGRSRPRRVLQVVAVGILGLLAASLIFVDTFTIASCLDALVYNRELLDTGIGVTFPLALNVVVIFLAQFFELIRATRRRAATTGRVTPTENRVSYRPRRMRTRPERRGWDSGERLRQGRS